MMKKVIIWFVLILCLYSCDNDEQVVENKENKVLLLKIDYLTNSFEGGKEFEFEVSENFTISSNYQVPGDFGGIQLYYNELNEMLFDGTIIWMGLGEMSYPLGLDLPNTFSTIDENLDLPDTSLFENIEYDEFAYYPETINYSGIWSSIENLEIIQNFRDSNPNGKINLFLYTPSVGVGNPADWDWYIYMNN